MMNAKSKALKGVKAAKESDNGALGKDKPFFKKAYPKK